MGIFEYARLALDTPLWKWLDRGINRLWKRLAKTSTPVYGNG
jgi:hypothetical protein